MILNVYIFNLVKDHTKVLGFGTNRVVGKQFDKSGLSMGQVKSMSTLQNLCGIKKVETDKSVIEKIASKKIESKSKLLSGLDEEEKKSTDERKSDTSNVINVEQPQVEIVETKPAPAKPKKISLRNLL